MRFWEQWRDAIGGRGELRPRTWLLLHTLDDDQVYVTLPQLADPEEGFWTENIDGRPES